MFDKNISPTPAIEVLDNNKTIARVIDNRLKWGVANTRLGNVLIAHGNSDGTLNISEETLKNIFQYNSIALLITCYPKQVGERYPFVKPVLLFPSCAEVTWRNYWSKGKGRDKIATHIIFSLTQKEITGLRLSQCSKI